MELLRAEGDQSERSSPMSNPVPIVFAVEDDICVRESLELLILKAGWRAETFGSAQQFLSRPQAPGPTCLILDLALPDIDGFELQRCLTADLPHMPIIFITGSGNVPVTILQAVKGGAVEFLTKPLCDRALLSAVETAIECSRAASADEAEIRTLRERHASLSRRETEVMALVVRGLLNKQVGAELGISEVTVKAHRGKAMQKMGARSLPDLVMMAARLRGATKT